MDPVMSLYPEPGAMLDENHVWCYLESVPTAIYRVPNQAWTQQPTIPFYNVNGQRGISLQAAINKSSRDLANPNDPVFDDTSRVKVTFHIKWGEYAFFSKARNVTTQRKSQISSITREKAAYEVAKLVRIFIDQYAQHLVRDNYWRVGPNYIDLQHVYLLELRNVSVGSYQAILAVRRQYQLGS